jgi:hypothetical protein
MPMLMLIPILMLMLMPDGNANANANAHTDADADGGPTDLRAVLRSSHSQQQHRCPPQIHPSAAAAEAICAIVLSNSWGVSSRFPAADGRPCPPGSEGI